jgi:hypothetical protein
MVLEYTDKNVIRMFKLYETFSYHKRMMECSFDEERKTYANQLHSDIEEIEAEFPYELRFGLGLERTVLNNLKKVTEQVIRLP